MLNYYEGMESNDYEDYEITWKDVNDTEFKKKAGYKSLHTYRMSSPVA